MAVNLTLFPTEAPAVVWFENGDSQAYDPQQENSLQIPSGSVCTVSSTAGSTGEGTPEDKALAFAERMVAFWQTAITKARSEIKKAQPPTATPV
jgi:hypothetical protein